MSIEKFMTKTSRNSPCPCGSGKKFKRCCLNNGQKAMDEIVQKSIPLSRMGLPNQAQHIIMQPANGRKPGGEPGQYEVLLLLAKPGYSVSDETIISMPEQIDGNSHLAITKPAFVPPNDENADQILIRAQNDKGEQFEFHGIANKKGLLSKLRSNPFFADSLKDAYNKAHNMITPSLSNWSSWLDIPLFIECVQVNEISSGQKMVTWTTPFFETPFAVMPDVILTRDFRGYLSLYREALVSNSPVYQFLCFFKVIESVRERRARLANEAKIRGEKFLRPKERIPANTTDGVSWLNAIYYVRPSRWDAMSLNSIFRKEALNAKFYRVIDDILRPLRNNIAHALLSEKGELNVCIDDITTINEVHNWLPLTKCLVRHMLKNEFPKEYLSNIDNSGNVS
jgi:hypothetical protein